MAPFKSSLAKSAGKLFGVFNTEDLDLRGAGQSTRFVLSPGNIEATGGAIATPGNGYRYHFITAPSQDFDVTSIDSRHPGTVEYFLVAGGGAGGGEYSTPNTVTGGGGGAGGVLTGPTPVSVQTYTINIGDGGAAPAAGRNGGNKGSNSTAFGLTAYGGGGGGHYDNGGASPGGSGGGSGRRTSAITYYGLNPSTPGPVLSPIPLPSPYPITQGYPGGQRGGDANDGGGGGGGAGAAGANGSNSGADGGIGVAAFSGDTGIPSSYGTIGPSDGRWFAGGGGGGLNGLGEGGAGGGGDAPQAAGLPGSQNGQAGGTNTGGGGSGGRSGSPGSAPEASGGAGGPGICIIRYTHNS